MRSSYESGDGSNEPLEEDESRDLTAIRAEYE
jgi:hypothetical protein